MNIVTVNRSKDVMVAAKIYVRSVIRNVKCVKRYTVKNAVVLLPNITANFKSIPT